MAALISILHETLTRLATELRSMTVLRPGDPENPAADRVFSAVYEQGMFANYDLDPGQAIAVLHANRERVINEVSTSPSSKYHLDLPIEVDVVFSRNATDTPPEQAYLILALMQEQLGALNVGPEGLPPGWTFIFYQGAGSQLEPVDQNDPVQRYQFVTQWMIRYRMSRTDARNF